MTFPCVMGRRLVLLGGETWKSEKRNVLFTFIRMKFSVMKHTHFDIYILLNLRLLMMLILWAWSFVLWFNTIRCIKSQWAVLGLRSSSKTFTTKMLLMEANTDVIFPHRKWLGFGEYHWFTNITKWKRLQSNLSGCDPQSRCDVCYPNSVVTYR